MFGSIASWHIASLPIIVLSCFIFLDLCIRYLAFGRLDSIAIDSAVFSTTYCIGKVIDCFSVSQVIVPSVIEWLIKAVAALMCLIALFVMHKILRDKLDRQIRVAINKANNVKNSSLEKAIPLIQKTSLLTFVSPFSSDSPLAKWELFNKLVRPGKRAWRTDSEELIATITKEFDGGELMLSTAEQAGGLIVFFLLGLVCLIVPAIVIIYK